MTEKATFDAALEMLGSLPAAWIGANPKAVARLMILARKFDSTERDGLNARIDKFFRERVPAY
jgi:hypothetical protein